MKNQLLGLLVTIATFQAAPAQPLRTVQREKEPKIIVAADFGLQWFNILTRFSSFKIEYAGSPYRHLCLHFSRILSGSSDEFNYNFGYNQLAHNGSFEIGLASKYFPHGRFTGRKSGFYVAPDVRFGVRNFVNYEYDFQTGTNIEYSFRHITSKLLFAWGVQWQFGKRVVFDLGAPIGVEYYQVKDERYPYNNTSIFSNRNIVMLPAVMMGYAF